MLDLRPNCECCDADLPPASQQARICSFECTFCVACAEGVLHGKCPNCGGELLRRPIRPADKLPRSPASTVRKLKPGGCVAALLLVMGMAGCAEQPGAKGPTATRAASGGAGFEQLYVGASTRYKASPRGCPSPSRLTFHVLNRQFTYRVNGTIQFEVNVASDNTLSAQSADYVLSGLATDDRIEGDVRNAHCGFHFLARRKN